AGPISGAWLVSYLSWRWIFGLNVALGLLALAIFWFSFPPREVSGSHALDWRGALLLTLGLGGLILLTSQALPESALVKAPGFALVLALLLGFVWSQRSASAPLIPLHPFKLPAYQASCLLGFSTNFVGFAALTYIPFYLQQVMQRTPADTGLIFTPMMVAWPIASALAGLGLNRLGFRSLCLLGCGFMVLSMLAWSAIAAGLGLPGLVFWCVCLGLGMGAVTAPLLIAAQTVVARHEIGAASATLVLLRNIGATLGVSLMGALQVRTMPGIGLQPSLMLIFVALAGFALTAVFSSLAMPACSPADLSPPSGIQ
ncbi:MAG: MFS transporter, partial [Candidatus Sericytochromatia bacterium]